MNKTTFLVLVDQNYKNNLKFMLFSRLPVLITQRSLSNKYIFNCYFLVYTFRIFVCYCIFLLMSYLTEVKRFRNNYIKGQIFAFIFINAKTVFII